MSFNFIGLTTIFYREVQRTLRVWIQSLMSPWVSALLYITVFGQIIGSRVSFFEGQINYIKFVFPGVLTLNVISSAFTHASFSVYYQRFTRHIEESLVAPLSGFDIVVGFVLGSLFRSLILAFGIYIIAIAFQIASISHLAQLFFYIVAIVILFSLLGILGGLWANSWEQVNSFEIFIIMPLVFLGGMFTSVSMISPRFQTVYKMNPFFYFIDGIRYSMIGIQETNPWTRFILVISLIVLAAFVVGYLFKKGYRLKN